MKGLKFTDFIPRGTKSWVIVLQANKKTTTVIEAIKVKDGFLLKGLINDKRVKPAIFIKSEKNDIRRVGENKDLEVLLQYIILDLIKNGDYEVWNGQVRTLVNRLGCEIRKEGKNVLDRRSSQTFKIARGREGRFRPSGENNQRQV